VVASTLSYQALRTLLLITLIPIPTLSYQALRTLLLITLIPIPTLSNQALRTLLITFIPIPTLSNQALRTLFVLVTIAAGLIPGRGVCLTRKEHRQSPEKHRRHHQRGEVATPLLHA
jgi:hypothetical protein